MGGLLEVSASGYRLRSSSTKPNQLYRMRRRRSHDLRVRSVWNWRVSVRVFDIFFTILQASGEVDMNNLDWSCSYVTRDYQHHDLQSCWWMWRNKRFPTWPVTDWDEWPVSVVLCTLLGRLTCRTRRRSSIRLTWQWSPIFQETKLLEYPHKQRSIPWMR